MSFEQTGAVPEQPDRQFARTEAGEEADTIQVFLPEFSIPLVLSAVIRTERPDGTVEIVGEDEEGDTITVIMDENDTVTEVAQLQNGGRGVLYTRPTIH
jgi:hypothetical protein